MPELPEVETVARTLAPSLTGRRLLELRVLHPRVTRGAPADLPQQLAGRLIDSIKRLGKFLLLGFRGGPTLRIHLGMTGQLLLAPGQGPHTRVLFTLDQGQLRYDDIRMFGRIELAAADAAAPSLGPDALLVSSEQFLSLFRHRRGRLKPLLLNQRILAGLGNIYADEALFEAHLHPLAPVHRLSRARLARLHQAIQSILAASIAQGGSSIANYVDAYGRQGRFQDLHRVYRQTGRPCPRCGAPIRRILVAQRATHYCPRCQR